MDGSQDPWNNRLLYIAAVVLALLIVAVVLTRLPTKTGEIDGDGDSENASLDGGGAAPDEFTVLREQMVDLIRDREVSDPNVLAAMQKVPRHLFVPDEQVRNAYEDHPLPIGYGQTISQPWVVAAMTEALQLEPGVSKALEVGTGSGYQAAILAEICAEVSSVEIVAPLASRANETLREVGFTNFRVKNDDGYFGWKEHGPYDAIIVTCAASHIPPPLVEQLAEGGRLILPLGSPHTWQTLTILEKKDGNTSLRYLSPVVFVPMTGEIEKG